VQTRVNTREQRTHAPAGAVVVALRLLLRMTEGTRSITIMTLNDLPPLLTVDETAALLRTSRKAVYAMAERSQLPGVTRIGRRLLIRSGDLMHWLDQKSSATSLKA
jgi:excisionase family DNA binding protein